MEHISAALDSLNRAKYVRLLIFFYRMRFEINDRIGISAVYSFVGYLTCVCVYFYITGRFGSSGYCFTSFHAYLR